jgi:hypothetical protein
MLSIEIAAPSYREAEYGDSDKQEVPAKERLFPIVFEEQFFNSVSVKHVVHREVAKHDEDRIVSVLAMLCRPLPIFVG